MTGLFLEKLLGRPVYKISQNATLSDVAEKLVSFNIGALPVVDNSENLKGIISERDLVKVFYAIQTQDLLKNHLNADVFLRSNHHNFHY